MEKNFENEFYVDTYWTKESLLDHFLLSIEIFSNGMTYWTLKKY